MFANDEYGRRTFEFVEAIRGATTSDEICELILKEMTWYGFTFVTVWSLLGPGKELRETFDLNTRPQSYIDHYNKAQYVDRDPVVTAMRRALTSLSWSDVKAQNNLSKEERFIIEEGRDFGAEDGLTIPIMSSSGCIGVFSPCGKNPDLTPRARSAVEIVGIYAQQALHRLATQDLRAKEHYVPLTPREREVMRWAALGKTDGEISSILNIDFETARTHMKNVKRKLNASSRSYAVAQAVRLGEISF